MRVQQQCAAFAVCVFVVGAAACADRGDTYSENRADGPAATLPNANNDDRTAMNVTGCFQDMSGPNNYVLSNVGDAGASPSDKRAYRIERRGDFEQYVGKQVTISGWVDRDAKEAAQGTPAGRTQSGELDFNDLPELHVEKISALSEACGSARK